MSMAEDILNGVFCEECGGYVDGEEPGYPRKCEDCKPKKNRKKRKKGRE